MHARICAGLVIHPLRFPEELEILIFPLDRESDRLLGGSFPMIQHHTLDWARVQYPLGGEDENQLRAGRRVNVFTGYVVAEFPDEIVFPKGAAVERMDSDARGVSPA
jgi:hypothetical protein